MLSYNEFKQYIEKNIINVLPAEHKQVTIIINEIPQNNGNMRTALTIKQEGSFIAPNIYLDGFYEEYKDGAEPDVILSEIVEIYLEDCDKPIGADEIVETFLNVDSAKDKIIMAVINTNKNAELLSNVPHTNFMDLSLIYKVLISSKRGDMLSATISNSQLQQWNISVEELHSLAVKNTRELLPIDVNSLCKHAEQLRDEIGMPEEMMPEILTNDVPENKNLWIITNQQQVLGATCMFYMDVLSDLAKKIGTDLYILPSSIHEVLAITTQDNDAFALRAMVQTVNKTLDEDLQLSDKVYYFHAATKELKIVE